MNGYKLRRLKRELACPGAVVNFYKDTMELPTGEKQTWDFLEHRRGGACVIPVLQDGRLLMVRQYRPAIDQETLELPAGARDNPEEDTRTTAERELEEETGCRAGSLRRILQLKSAPAYCTETTDVYLAENLESIGHRHLDDAEEIYLEAWPVERLKEMIYRGEIQDSKTVAGILAYCDLYGHNHS